MKRFQQHIMPAILLMCTTQAFAQNAPAPKADEGSNLMAVLLVVVALVLAFVIWGLGQALIAMHKLAFDKNKQAGKVLGIVLMLCLSQTMFAQDAAVTGAVAEAAPNYGGMSANNFYAFVAVIGIEVVAILFLGLALRNAWMDMQPQKAVVPGTASSFSKWWEALDKKFFTKAVAVEKEADVLLDHNYDGIQELDNSLPPWWKYGFYVTIFVAIFYLGYFHAWGSGKNPTQEYAAEMEQARVEKEMYEATNKDKVDENNVPMADATGIKAGQVLFEADCVACHLKDGGGNVGPNLTDDYWIHKGSLNDIFKSIKNGYPDKGMQAWSIKYNPKEISELAGYIKTLRGTKPAAPKAAQGDLYVEEVKAAADSAVAPKKDSVPVKGAK